MDFFTLGKQDNFSEDLELIEKYKREFYLLGSFQKTSGLELFYYNLSTGEVSKADYEKCKIGVWTETDKGISIEPLERDKLVIQSNCEYFEALNLSSAQKRVDKWLAGKIKCLFNLRPPRYGKLDIFSFEPVASKSGKF